MALCSGHLVASDCIHRASSSAATGGQSSRSASDPVAHGHRAQASGGASADGALASNRLAPRHLAQWNAAAATARFAAVRVTPAHEWRHARLAPEVWLLCQEETGSKTRLKSYFVALPATASLGAVVQLAHQRWAIEQQYQELKSELGLDHFEGRSYPGWYHHVVLTAVAHAFIQRERMRRTRGPTLTFPAARAIVQEIFTALLVAAKPAVHALDGTGETKASTTDLTKSN